MNKLFIVSNAVETIKQSICADEIYTACASAKKHLNSREFSKLQDIALDRLLKIGALTCRQ